MDYSGDKHYFPDTCITKITPSERILCSLLPVNLTASEDSWNYWQNWIPPISSMRLGPDESLWCHQIHRPQPELAHNPLSSMSLLPPLLLICDSWYRVVLTDRNKWMYWRRIVITARKEGLVQETMSQRICSPVDWDLLSSGARAATCSRRGEIAKQKKRINSHQSYSSPVL